MDSREPYEFTQNTKSEISKRQDGRCAGCGKPVKAGEDTYHHVITVQEARKDDKKNRDFYRSSDNGVMLHNGHFDDGETSPCHAEAHDGRFQTFTSAPKEFPHSHTDKHEHAAWAHDLESRIRDLHGNRRGELHSDSENELKNHEDQYAQKPATSLENLRKSHSKRR